MALFVNRKNISDDVNILVPTLSNVLRKPATQLKIPSGFFAASPRLLRKNPIFDTQSPSIPGLRFFSKFRPCYFLHFIDPQHQAKFQKKLMSSLTRYLKTEQRTNRQGRLLRTPSGKPGVQNRSILSVVLS